MARFLVGVKSVEWEFPWQGEDEARELRVFCDSDWAGCWETRRSTSGGVLMLGRHPLRTWSTTQSTVATSSAEAELYSLADGTARGLGFQSTLGELSINVKLKSLTDSSAAKAFASTRGLGRMRHVQVKDLWIQALAQAGRVILCKVRGDSNVADAFTKYLGIAKCTGVLAFGGMKVVPAESTAGPRGGVKPSVTITSVCHQPEPVVRTDYDPSPFWLKH